MFSYVSHCKSFAKCFSGLLTDAVQERGPSGTKKNVE